MLTAALRTGFTTLSCLFLGAAIAHPAERHVVVISIDGLPAHMHDDPKASMPTLRKLRAKGVISAKGMTVSNPSVTWPNHTTLMTGVQPEKHGVLFNGRLARNGPGLPVRVEPKATQAELVAVPMLFDTLKAAGMSTAAINWPCTRGSESIDDNFPDVPESVTHSTPRLMEELKSQGVLDPDEFMKLSPPGRDEIWTLAACQVIRERKPRFLTLHLLNVDAIHHTYGAQTPASYTAVALADALVGRVLDAVHEAGLEENTTVLIVSDHGFTKIPQTLSPNVMLRKAGLLTLDGKQVATARVHAIPEGGIAMVYLTQPDSVEADRKAVFELFADQEGIEAVLTPDRFAKYHLPQPDDHPGMADLILVAKDGYGFNGDAAGEDDVTASTGLGTHGFLSTLPKMNATFIASGAGIRKDGPLDLINNSDVAPTAAKLLGVTMENVDGRVLDEILAE